MGSGFEPSQLGPFFVKWNPCVSNVQGNENWFENRGVVGETDWGKNYRVRLKRGKRLLVGVIGRSEKLSVRESRDFSVS